jgi:hypothetical protein
MAARRLIALLVVLLVISSIATALAPPQDGGEESSTTSTTTSEPAPDDGRAAADAGVVTASIDALAKDNDPVEAEVGDQLALSVRSPKTSEIEIPALGLYDTAAPGAPALFDVVLRSGGELEVLADGKPAGTIRVGTGGGAKGKPGPKSGEQGDRPKEQGHRGNGSPVEA